MNAAAVDAPRSARPVGPRTALLGAIAVGVGLAAGGIARVLGALIGLITNLAFYHRLSADWTSPADHALGLGVVLVPVVGGLVVGAMARWGSPAIRGHGIPEAMETVLANASRIPPRLVVLKPLSAAIAIGTGGPFGAEGPIIATGGALGSITGQLLPVTAAERKTLLAAGAAAGMAATFGSPVSAVLLAVELLLFEYRPASVIPVALASVAATAVRIATAGTAPVFALPELAQPSGAALVAYVALGVVLGAAAAAVTHLVYLVEDAFERLPLHWMWWPALGGVVVGAIGFVAPRTLGVGYVNIEDIASGRIVGGALVTLTVLKLVSWAIALGSGTSGGTLAPLFTIGAGAGALVTGVVAHAAPWLGLDAHVGALVGMAALFSGASHALLASVVFAFETTRQPIGLLPLLGGCSGAFLVAQALRPHSIMTEKIVRRGARVPQGYAVDFLDLVLARDAATQPVVTLDADATLASVRDWIARGQGETTHQGFPVVAPGGELVGVVTRRDLLEPGQPGSARVRDVVRRPPVVVWEDSSLREAADQMVHAGVGRLPVVSRSAPRRVRGMLTRSDLLAAHHRRLDEAQRREVVLRVRRRRARLVDGERLDGAARGDVRPV